MVATIINKSSGIFTNNGIDYVKNFIVTNVGESITVMNAYDTRFKLFTANYADVSVDGNTFVSVELLIASLAPILFVKASVTGGGDMLVADYGGSDSVTVNNADTVNNLTVETAVPAGAVFTDNDTVYDDTALSAKANQNETDIAKLKTYKVTSITGLKSIIGVSVGDTVRTDSYYGDNNGGGNDYICVSLTVGLYIDDGGFIIIANNDNVYQAVVKNSTLSIKQFGGKGDGIEGDEVTGDDSSAYENLIKWQDLEDNNVCIIDEGVFNCKRKALTVTKNIKIRGVSKERSILYNLDSISYRKSVYVEKIKFSYCWNKTIIPNKYKDVFQNKNSTIALTGEEQVIDIYNVHSYYCNNLINQSFALPTNMSNVYTNVFSNDFEKTCTGGCRIEGLIQKGVVKYNKVFNLYNIENATLDITDINYSNAGSSHIDDPENDTNYAFYGLLFGKSGSNSKNITFSENYFDKVMIGYDSRTFETQGLANTNNYCILSYSSNSIAFNNILEDSQRGIYLRGGGNSVQDNHFINNNYPSDLSLLWKAGTNSDPNFLILNNKFIGKHSTFLKCTPTTNFDVIGNNFKFDTYEQDFKTTTGYTTYISNRGFDFDGEANIERIKFKSNYIKINGSHNYNFISYDYSLYSSIFDIYIEDNTILWQNTNGSGFFLYGVNIDNIYINDNRFIGYLLNLENVNNLHIGNLSTIKKDDTELRLAQKTFLLKSIDNLYINNMDLTKETLNPINYLFQIWYFKNIYLTNVLIKSYTAFSLFYLYNGDTYISLKDCSGGSVGFLYLDASTAPVDFTLTVDEQNGNYPALFTADDNILTANNIITVNRKNNNSNDIIMQKLSAQSPPQIKMIKDYTIENNTNKIFIESSDILDINTTNKQLNKDSFINSVFGSAFYIFIKSIKYNYKKGATAYTGDTTLQIIEKDGGQIFGEIDISGGSVDGYIEVNKYLVINKDVLITTSTSNPLSGDGELTIELIYDFNFINDNTNLPAIVNESLQQSVNVSDTATPPGAAYVQSEMQAILDELRDVKTKLINANLMA